MHAAYINYAKIAICAWSNRANVDARPTETGASLTLTLVTLGTVVFSGGRRSLTRSPQALQLGRPL